MSKNMNTRKKRMTEKERQRERQKRRQRRRQKRAAIVVVEVLVLAALCAAGYVMLKLGKMDFHILDQEKLEVYKDTGPFTNIALFGLDSRNGELDGGVQSDCIMIASINNETNDVKLISVFRDTLLMQDGGTYAKANAAYNRGGPEEAISLLNRNFDLDIRNYVSVNFTALVNTIDALGGIEIDMTEEEAHWCNAYSVETAQITGREVYYIEEKAGPQLLDGAHAVAFARVRYTEGNDFKRTDRQREVLVKTAEKAKKANLVTLNKIVDQVFPQISTSFSVRDLLAYAANGLNYNIVETTGFPYAVTTSKDVRDHKGSFVVPIGFTDNVKQLHQNIFGEEWYEPSGKVKQIDNDIVYLTGIEEGTTAMKITFEENGE